MTGGEGSRTTAMAEWKIAMLPALAVSFALIAVSITAMAIIADSVTKESVNSLVGEQSTFAAHSALSRIDEKINDWVGSLRELGADPTIRAALARHNAGGGVLPEPLRAHAVTLLRDMTESRGLPFVGIALIGADGRVVASGGDDVTKSGIKWEELAGGDDAHVFDVRQHTAVDIDVMDIVVSLGDGEVHGDALWGVVGMEEIYSIAATTRDGVRLGESTADVYRIDGRPIYSSSSSTVHDSFELIAHGFTYVPEEVQDELERRFADIEKERERVLTKYGFEEPTLNDTEAIEYMERIEELEERYAAEIAEAEDTDYATEGVLDEAQANVHDTDVISDLEVAELNEIFDAYDKEYREIAAEYGISAPVLEHEEEEALAAELARIDAMFATVYNDLDVDYTFGDRGFVIVGHGTEETLHSFSRQAGYGDFDGLGWTFVLHTNLNEALADTNAQRNSLLILAAVIGTGAAALSAYLARTMYVQSRTLRRSEKITAIGQLASNIAHDLRNPLGIIRNSTERIRRKSSGQDGVVDGELDRINRAISRMSHQIEGVLNYVRTTPVIASECPMLPMLKYAMESIEIPSNITVELPGKDAVIECDREKIEITFANLLLNAVHAIDGKDGRIIVRVAEGEDDITIEFENTGLPIPDDDLPHVFEPLFTTKLKGTGLGLSSCRNIVEQHGGTIRASSEPVVFTMTLPRRQGKGVRRGA